MDLRRDYADPESGVVALQRDQFELAVSNHLRDASEPLALLETYATYLKWTRDTFPHDDVPTMKLLEVRISCLFDLVVTPQLYSYCVTTLLFCVTYLYIMIGFYARFVLVALYCGSQRKRRSQERFAIRENVDRICKWGLFHSHFGFAHLFGFVDVMVVHLLLNRLA